MTETTDRNPIFRDSTSRSSGEIPATSYASGSRVIAPAALLSGIVAVLTLGFPLPPPLSTITLAPIAIFVAGIYYGPKIGLVAGALGSAVGFVLGVNLGTISLGGTPALFPVFLIGIIVARGPEGLILGFLRRFDESLAMIVGTVYETLAFFAIDLLYTYPILLGFNWSASLATASLDLITLVDLIYIGPAMLVLRGLRGQFGRKYYDSLGAA